MPESTDGGPFRVPWCTAALGLVCTVAFAISWAASGFVLLEEGGWLDAQVLVEHGALDWLSVREKQQWWRLGTAPLLHGAWWHFLINAWGLFVLGTAVEDWPGRRWWTATALVSGLTTGLAVLAWGRETMVVGVSGVLFGFAGFLIVDECFARLARFKKASPEGTQTSESSSSKTSKDGTPDAVEFPIGQLSGYIGLAFAAGWVWPELSQVGHIGGLVGGALVGLARASRWTWPVVTGAVLGLGWVAAGAVNSEPTTPEGFARLGDAYLQVERHEEAWTAYDSALLAADSDHPGRGSWLNNGAYARAIGSLDPTQWKRGLVQVDEALEERPEDPNWLDTRGWLLCRLGRVSEGLEALNQARESSEGEPSEELLDHLENCRID